MTLSEVSPDPHIHRPAEDMGCNSRGACHARAWHREAKKWMNKKTVTGTGSFEFRTGDGFQTGISAEAEECLLAADQNPVPHRHRRGDQFLAHIILMQRSEGVADAGGKNHSIIAGRIEDSVGYNR